MATKSKAYVDSSAFIAFLDKSDSYHVLFNHLFSNPPILITTPLVINETHAWFLRRYDIFRGAEFLSFIESLKPKILSIGDKDIKAASLIVRKFSDQKLTLTDAMGLNIIKKQNIKECWSTDRHLGLLGADLVIHLK
mgnify:CR=1 FL=1